MLTDIGELACKALDTPTELNHQLSDAPEDKTIDKSPYQRLVGRLIYLSHTRPDITYVVSVVSQFMPSRASPKEVHLREIHKILQ